MLVPADFDTDLLDDALVGAGFNPKAPAFFSWIGAIIPARGRPSHGGIGVIYSEGEVLVGRESSPARQWCYAVRTRLGRCSRVGIF